MSPRSARRRARPPARPSPPPIPLASVVPWLGPAAVAAAGTAMLAWTWRTWPDVTVDFGRELNFAWRLSEGAVLYRDVVHFCGPLSVYLNALWFRLFGPGIMTLAWCNIAIAAATAGMLHALCVRVADRLAATAAGLVFVTLFACGTFVRIGNYNWVCPYSHELPHGAALALAALVALARYHRDGRLAWIAAMGAALGLLVLTKVEMLVGGGAAIATGLALTLVVERPDRRRAARLAGVFAAAALVPLAVTAIAFSAVLPADEVLRWPLGHWRAASRPEMLTMPFYLEGVGIGDVPGNLRKMAVAIGCWTALVAPGVVAAIVCADARARRAWVPPLLFVVMAGALWAWSGAIDWFAGARALPLFMLLALAATAAACVRRRAEAEAARRMALAAALAALGAGLLAKMVLNARVYHYGFVLAMPASAVLVVALVAWLPAAIEARGGHGAAFRAVALAVLAVGVSACLPVMGRVLAHKIHPVGEGRDLFFADDRGPVVAKLLAEVRARVPPGGTLAVVPEGVMVNYLARRENPTRFYQLGPLIFVLWSRDEIQASFERHPPDWIVLLHKNTAHEGRRFFGRDYARRLSAWIEARYRPVAQVGARPFQNDDRFGAIVMERAGAVSPPPATSAP